MARSSFVCKFLIALIIVASHQIVNDIFTTLVTIECAVVPYFAWDLEKLVDLFITFSLKKQSNVKTSIASKNIGWKAMCSEGEQA